MVHDPAAFTGSDPKKALPAGTQILLHAVYVTNLEALYREHAQVCQAIRALEGLARVRCKRPAGVSAAMKRSPRSAAVVRVRVSEPDHLAV